MKMSRKDHQAGFRRSKGVFCVSEAAEVLCVSRETLYRWEEADIMPERVTVGSGTRTYYRRSDILTMHATRQALLLGDVSE